MTCCGALFLVCTQNSGNFLEQANLGKEPTLEEASSNIKPGDTNATTSENEGKTAAKEKTADNAGPPDGAADL